MGNVWLPEACCSPRMGVTRYPGYPWHGLHRHSRHLDGETVKRPIFWAHRNWLNRLLDFCRRCVLCIFTVYSLYILVVSCILYSIFCHSVSIWCCDGTPPLPKKAASNCACRRCIDLRGASELNNRIFQLAGWIYIWNQLDFWGEIAKWSRLQTTWLCHYDLLCWCLVHG